MKKREKVPEEKKNGSAAAGRGGVSIRDFIAHSGGFYGSAETMYKAGKLERTAAETGRRP